MTTAKEAEMSDSKTPRVDALVEEWILDGATIGNPNDLAEATRLARQLETELAAANERTAEAVRKCDALLDGAEADNDFNESHADSVGADESATYHRGARKELAKVRIGIRAAFPPQYFQEKDK